MMLHWLPGCAEAGRMIDAAVARVLAAPKSRTPDLGGRLTTRELGDRITAAIAG
jgi:isocitrate/isopropylmalate dehydrogenase